MGIKIGINALWPRLDKLELSFKKTLHASERFRPDVQAARQKWKRDQVEWDASRLVFSK